MAQLVPDGEDVKCSSCDVVMMITWHRNPVYDRVEYCPFCGDDIFKIDNDPDNAEATNEGEGNGQ